MRKVLAISSLFLLVTIILVACNFPNSASQKVSSPDVVATAAALTVQALSTQLAGGTEVSPVSPNTSTVDVTLTPQPTQASSSATAAPPTMVPASATPATPTPTPIPCDRAKFVSETIPDGTSITPGANFTKTWVLKNNGSCTWNSGYSLVFVSGDAMGGPAAQQLTTGSVAPGQDVEIKVDLKAPSTEGTYRGNWKLRNATGAVFGVGNTADQLFWVEVKVSASPASFIESYCLADWTSDAGTLPCPGKSGDASGFVTMVNNPKLENGATDNEPALWTNPQNGDNGQISGRFPAMKVPSGAHFRTIVGCFYDSPNCKVKFQLKYIADGGSVQSLGEWNESYDGNFTKVDVDVNSLAGKSVQFILTVLANGSSEGNKAFWLNPSVK